MDDERLQLAYDIIDETVGANGLSIRQLEFLGWDACKFGYYGKPTADEVKRKAREIIDEREADSKSIANAAMVAGIAGRMTPAEFREYLARAGIIDGDGRLAKPYRRDDDE